MKQKRIASHKYPDNYGHIYACRVMYKIVMAARTTLTNYKIK